MQQGQAAKDQTQGIQHGSLSLLPPSPSPHWDVFPCPRAATTAACQGGAWQGCVWGLCQELFGKHGIDRLGEQISALQYGPAQTVSKQTIVPPQVLLSFLTPPFVSCTGSAGGRQVPWRWPWPCGICSSPSQRPHSRQPDPISQTPQLL